VRVCRCPHAGLPLSALRRRVFDHLVRSSSLLANATSPCCPPSTSTANLLSNIRVPVGMGRSPLPLTPSRQGREYSSEAPNPRKFFMTRWDTCPDKVIVTKTGVRCMPSSLEPYASPFISQGIGPDVGRSSQPLSQHAFSYFVVPPTRDMTDF